MQVDGAALLSEVEHVSHTRPSSRHEGSISAEPQVSMHLPAYQVCMCSHVVAGVKAGASVSSSLMPCTAAAHR